MTPARGPLVLAAKGKEADTDKSRDKEPSPEAHRSPLPVRLVVRHGVQWSVYGVDALGEERVGVP